MTHQRLEIFREVASSSEHPSAEAIYKAVQPRMPTVSLDTVYRTMWLLDDLGLVTTLGRRREGIRFDANLADHHHYVCMQCGLIHDFEHAAFNALQVPEPIQRCGSVLTVQVEVRGVCKRCAMGYTDGSVNRSPNNL